MKFINNKYAKWYYDIIENAQVRVLSTDAYTEQHHIIPRSLNGSNSQDNLVKLTAREHFVCHLILTKIVEGPAYYKMLSAVTKFRQSRKYQRRVLTSWEYQKIRECAVEARKGQTHTAEARKKISDKHHDVSGSNNPMHGKLGEDNPKSKRYWAISPEGQEYDFVGMEQFCKQNELFASNAINVAQGKQTHHKGWAFGYVDESGTKIPTVYTAGQQEQTCPYCNATMKSNGNYLRWHGDNCRFKNIL